MRALILHQENCGNMMKPLTSCKPLVGVFSPMFTSLTALFLAGQSPQHTPENLSLKYYCCDFHFPAHRCQKTPFYKNTPDPHRPLKVSYHAKFTLLM